MVNKICGLISCGAGGGIIALASGQDSAIIVSLCGIAGGLWIMNGVMDIVRQEIKESQYVKRSS